MKDKTEFDLMFRKWYKGLFLFANQYLQDTEGSRDAVHDAFEYAWCNYRKIKSSELKAYLYSTVRSRCIDTLRRRNLSREYAEFVRKITEPYTDIHEIRQREERMSDIRKALKLLSPMTGTVLRKCYHERKSYRETAAELNISISSVHKHIVKALRLIRSEVRNKYREK